MPRSGQRNSGHGRNQFTGVPPMPRRGDDDPANEAYCRSMHAFLIALIGILMLATLGVLLTGMIGMAREGNPRRSNKLMQLRVLLQGAAILLFVILMSLLRS
jgi:hypothetical protein